MGPDDRRGAAVTGAPPLLVSAPPTMTVRLAPSLLSADFARLADQIAAVEATGLADRLHVDVMDGVFVPTITIGPLVVEAIRRSTRLPLDVHLMVQNPAAHLAAFVQAGADQIFIHVEACPHLHRDLLTIRRLGCRAGVALNPGTPVGWLEVVLGLVDAVLVMTVNPGWGGQEFLPETVEKIVALREWRDRRGLRAEIVVDGGINPQTAPLVQRAGAEVLVAGSAVFRHPAGIAAGLQALARSVGRATEPH